MKEIIIQPRRSGKTTKLFQEFLEFTGEGLSALFICPTRDQALDLQKQVPEYKRKYILSVNQDHGSLRGFGTLFCDEGLFYVDKNYDFYKNFDLKIRSTATTFYKEELLEKFKFAKSQTTFHQKMTLDILGETYTKSEIDKYYYTVLTDPDTEIRTEGQFGVGTDRDTANCAVQDLKLTLGETVYKTEILGEWRI